MHKTEDNIKILACLIILHTAYSSAHKSRLNRNVACLKTQHQLRATQEHLQSHWGLFHLQFLLLCLDKQPHVDGNLPKRPDEIMSQTLVLGLLINWRETKLSHQQKPQTDPNSWWGETSHLNGLMMLVQQRSCLCGVLRLIHRIMNLIGVTESSRTVIWCMRVSPMSHADGFNLLEMFRPQRTTWYWKHCVWLNRPTWLPAVAQPDRQIGGLYFLMVLNVKHYCFIPYFSRFSNGCLLLHLLRVRVHWTQLEARVDGDTGGGQFNESRGNDQFRPGLWLEGHPISCPSPESTCDVMTPCR